MMKLFFLSIFICSWTLCKSRETCHSRNFHHVLKQESDDYLIYGLTQDCQIVFLRPSQIALLSTLNVNIYNSYCHPNLVQMHLQSGDTLLLVTKQAGNRICTLNVTIPPFDLLFGDHLFSYSIFNSLSYAVCSHSPPNSYQLEADLSFLDTIYNNVIYFINGHSEGSDWNVLQFFINSEGYLRYLDKIPIENHAKREWTGPDIANEYVVGLDTQRNFLFKRNRFQPTFDYECAYDLLFRPTFVTTQYGNDSAHKAGTWLNSIAADNNILLYPETDRTVSPPVTYIRSKNVSSINDTSSYCLTTIGYSMDMGIVRESTLLKIQKNPLPLFDTNGKMKKPSSISSMTTHRHRKTTLKAVAPEVTTINSVMTSVSGIKIEEEDDISNEDEYNDTPGGVNDDQEHSDLDNDAASTSKQKVVELPIESHHDSSKGMTVSSGAETSDDRQTSDNLQHNSQSAHMNKTSENSSVNLQSTMLSLSLLYVLLVIF